MNFDFLKDIVKLVPNIKVGFVANSLKSNVNFIIDEHIKDREFDEDEKTLLDKLVMICVKFLQNDLNTEALYKIMSSKLDLSESQFQYFYDRCQNDMQIRDVVKRIMVVAKSSDDSMLKSKFNSVIEDYDYNYIANFLVQECNNAVKYH
ncbi:hypothetical protein SlGVgp100 [Spodoptera litura granulovirus]|uniref:Ac75 n=1 Tax=Spodoptera litura granulovirus TaxID=359919 RepID=A5IZV2_9BBAC|nr:hypothetical protein SlGVgp100 [Spodoptera litura granulovirus]ABQ52043.1 hypothetical protein SlGVgp100 [Spodoptera litura granulovirus]